MDRKLFSDVVPFVVKSITSFMTETNMSITIKPYQNCSKKKHSMPFYILIQLIEFEGLCIFFCGAKWCILRRYGNTTLPNPFEKSLNTPKHAMRGKKNPILS